MSFFSDQQEYASCYRRELRADVNRLGLLLLLFFGVMQVIGWTVGEIVKAVSGEAFFNNSNTIQMLRNGIVTTLTFFLVSVIYCLFTRQSWGRLFPFARVGGRRVAALCVIGLTLSLMSNIAAEGVTDVFSLFGVTNRGGESVGSDSVFSIPIYYLTVAVLPALAEEFAFRGVLMGSLRKHSDALALLVSSAAFALMHGNFIQIPFAFCCGLAFGLIAIKTNSLLPTILIHFLNNALSITGEVLTGFRVITPLAYNILFHTLILILGVCSLFLIRQLLRIEPQMLRFPDSDNRLPFREKMKTAVSSPTMIAFTAIMLLYAIYVLVRPFLEV